jgi:hypothetical protein
VVPTPAGDVADDSMNLQQLLCGLTEGCLSANEASGFNQLQRNDQPQVKRYVTIWGLGRSYVLSVSCVDWQIVCLLALPQSKSIT